MQGCSACGGDGGGGGARPGVVTEVESLRTEDELLNINVDVVVVVIVIKYDVLDVWLLGCAYVSL